VVIGWVIVTGGAARRHSAIRWVSPLIIEQQHTAVMAA
jgi:hypothetical protein